MKALIIGYGSIGSLHVRVLNKLGLDVTIVSSRAIEYDTVAKSIKEAMSGHVDYAVVSSITARHESDLRQLEESGFRGTALVEKPLFSQARSSETIYPFRIFVGYNLRFHPVIQKARRVLEGQKIISAHAYVGQHLSTWRSNMDHLQAYSARRDLGGGVLRDLSHELDLLQYLFGSVQHLKAIGGRYANITIDSDDTYALLISTSNCPVISLQLNYLDRVSRRQIIVNTETNTYMLDLVKGVFSDSTLDQSFDLYKELTYERMHCAILQEGGKQVCTFEEGLKVVGLIEKAEQDALRLGPPLSNRLKPM